MIDDLPRDEAERLLGLTKFGDPSTGWRRRQQTVSWAKYEFGVTHAEGRRIQGITADLSVRYGRRPHLKQFLFSMYYSQHRGNRRAYQLDVFQSDRRPVDAHQHPHEHVGRDRLAGHAEWCAISFAGALLLFCRKTNLTLTCVLPDPSVPESK
jgi:hypothetical protein